MKKIITVGIICILTIGLAGCSWFQPAEPTVEEPEVIETPTVTEEPEEVMPEYFSEINENTVKIVSEDLSVTFEDNFRISENIIQFGPDTHIPESPTDKEYVRPAYRMTVTAKRSFDDILKDAEENPDVALEPTTEKINNLEVAKWASGGLCEYHHFEIIGENNNIHLQSQSCEDLAHEKYLTDFINNII